MVLSSNKHIECDLLWKVEGAVTLVLRRIPEIKAGGSAKGLCLMLNWKPEVILNLIKLLHKVIKSSQTTLT